LTTNALVLSKMLPQLLEAGLTHINISLDTLLDFKYAALRGRRAAEHPRRAHPRRAPSFANGGVPRCAAGGPIH